ncbi:P-loop NTPase fold protein [Pasteurella multocida]|uniref:P-loop NTPase fold protein n=1 Tax=Pasteurella multocida TaxID=747 RepID=UPI00223E1075|nr:P-loop NTPase fold protein [Pasteurella multocida]UZJ27177.1 KAP family NTPase [Pasteurella multocida]
MNEHIEEYLDIYLTKENIEYATVLTGEWGCGKTYFIRNYIKKKENKKEYKFIYVSLFGLKSISSINQIIFQELHPILSRKEIKALGGALLSAIKFGVKIDLTGGDEKETSVNIDLSKLTIFNNSSYSDLIFIFDDLERTMIDFIEILGFINSLCEKTIPK